MELPVATSYEDIYSTFTIPCKKSKMVSFTSSIIKTITLLFAPIRLPVKLVCVVSGSASGLVVYLNLLLSFYVL